LNDEKFIKDSLEELYDIPFLVSKTFEYTDPVYTVVPQNDMEELFSVSIFIRQDIRIIIEIEPQKYAAGFVREINSADPEKRAKFISYYELIKNKGAKEEFIVNQGGCSPYDDQIWESEWNRLKVRITKIIDSEFDEESRINTICEWSKIATGLILSLLNVEKLIPEEKQYSEGTKTKVVSERYERNPVNRELCLAANGYVCKICGFDFEKIYGKIGSGFIHVHHIEKVADHGGTYYLNPVKDMIPVCPNCHAMLHRKDPPYLPDELRTILNNRNYEGEAGNE